MQTDIPLKTLIRARPADLLPLLGSPDATVLGVESLELPMVTLALDTLVRLRSARGTIYLHLVEWQGYKDPLFLWRALGYLAEVAQQKQYRDLVIMVTLVYLHPGDDVGDTLRQELDGELIWSIPFRVVRLWEQDADAAVASGLPGLAVLSPLMRGASAELVEQAATLVLERAEPGRQQADLLTILGVFAEPLLRTERFIRMVGRERLMASELITYLMGETLEQRAEELAERRVAERVTEAERRVAERAAERAAEAERALVQKYAAVLEQERAAREQERAELEQERAAREQERAAREQERAAREQERAAHEQERAAHEQERAAHEQELTQMVEAALIARFPTAPLTLAAALRRVHEPQDLLALHAAVLHAPDLASVERILQSP